jgi:hypothetical protein
MPVPGSLLMHAERWTTQDRSKGSGDGDADVGSRRSEEPAKVLFRVRCAAMQAYVLLRPARAPAKIIPLHETEPDEWETRLHLPPDVYRYRFYVDDGTRLICFAASDVTGHHVVQFDGRLLVPPQNELPDPSARGEDE